MKQKKNDAQVQMLFESIAAGAILTGGKFAYEIGKEIHANLKPDKPLLFKVNDSSSYNGQYQVDLSFINYSVHSVYIESVSLSDPKDRKITIRFLEINAKGYGFGSDDPKEAPITFPQIIKSKKELRFILCISELPPKRKEKKPYGKIKCSYSVLGIGSKPKSENFTFRLR